MKHSLVVVQSLLVVFALFFPLLLASEGKFHSEKKHPRTFRRSLQEDTDAISFSVTYRDFLPLVCISSTAQSPVTILFAEMFVPWQIDFNQTIAQAVREESCEADTESRGTLISSGVVKAHPDFEALGFITERGKCEGETIVNSCAEQFNDSIYSIVADELTIGTNGLPAIQYCSQNSATRCGVVINQSTGIETGFSQTSKEFFDVWYNDNPVYNKRIGQSLELQNEGSGLFSFNSGNEEGLEPSTGNNDAPDFGEDLHLDFFGPLSRFKLSTAPQLADILDDPLDAEAWPNTIDVDSFDLPTNQYNSDPTNKSYWFTTEIHTTFEFRNDSEMLFSFIGDDDFWAFINGQLVIDLGGTHPAFSASIDLNADPVLLEKLGLEHTEIYNLDIYHAERQTSRSSFRLTSTLFQACNVQQSGSIALDFSSIEEDYALHSSAVVLPDNSLQIQSAGKLFTAGYFFTALKENVGRGFIAEFDVLLTEDGLTEGFAFVVQSEGTDDFRISSGDTFSLDGVKNAFAVVFDLCSDRSDSCEVQNVSVHYEQNENSDGLEVNDDTRSTYDTVHRRLARNETFPVRIIHYGGRPNYLEVFVRDSLYLRENDFNISDIINGTGAHVGITATSSTESTDIIISNFNLQVVEVDPSLTSFLSDTGFELQEVRADGLDASDGFDIVTTDFCGNQLESGTLSELISAKYIEVSSGNNLQRTFRESSRFFFNGSTAGSVVDALITDNEDGSYTLSLQTTSPGSYGLVVAFGDGCEVAITNTSTIVEGTEIFVPVPSLKTDTSDTLDCFYQEFQDGSVIVQASEVFPVVQPTLEPTDSDKSDFIILIISISAGCVVLCGLCLAFLLVGYMRKWQKVKHFVPIGIIFQADRGTKYPDHDDYTTTAKKVGETQQEILDLKSKQVPLADFSEEVKVLADENVALTDIVKSAKQQAAVEPPVIEADYPDIKPTLKPSKNMKTEL